MGGAKGPSRVEGLTTWLVVSLAFSPAGAALGWVAFMAAEVAGTIYRRLALGEAVGEPFDPSWRDFSLGAQVLAGVAAVVALFYLAAWLADRRAGRRRREDAEMFDPEPG